MKKILAMLVLTLTVALAEAEPFPVEGVTLEATVSIWATVIDPIPVPWDAYRVVSDDLCDPERNLECYFVPGVDADEVYFVVGRYLHTSGARLITEVPDMQLWDLRPYLPGGDATGFMFSREFSDGTFLTVMR